jgi:hypothetical protein
MPDGSEFLCPRFNLPLKEVRTSGDVSMDAMSAAVAQ